MIDKKKVLKKSKQFLGKPQNTLISELGLIKGNHVPKNIRSLIAKNIIKNIDLSLLNKFSIRTITVNHNNSPKESLPLIQINYNEIINEQWENSKLFKYLNSEFLFLIFHEKSKNDKNPILKDIVFWKMSEYDLGYVKMFWELSKENISTGDYKNFITIKNNFICHVRTKGANGSDFMLTPQNTKEARRAFWLNASYIKHLIT